MELHTLPLAAHSYVLLLVLPVFTCVCALLLLQANTFQAVIATDGQWTFAFFIYYDIEWGNGATIGFNAGDGIRSRVVTTQPLDVETGSNVGVTGLYINRVDLSVILGPSDGEKIKLLHCMLQKFVENVNIPTICIFYLVRLL